MVGWLGVNGLVSSLGLVSSDWPGLWRLRECGSAFVCSSVGWDRDDGLRIGAGQVDADKPGLAWAPLVGFRRSGTVGAYLPSNREMRVSWLTGPAPRCH